jgi:hypothetical protein
MKFLGENSSSFTVSVYDYECKSTSGKRSNTNYLIASLELKSEQTNWQRMDVKLLPEELELMLDWFNGLKLGETDEGKVLYFTEENIVMSLVDCLNDGYLLQIELSDNTAPLGKITFTSFCPNDYLSSLTSSIKSFQEKFPTYLGFAGEDLNNKIPICLGEINGTRRWVYKNALNHIIEGPYDECVFFENHLAVIKRNNQYGAMDQKHKIIIPIEYNTLQLYPSGKALVSKIIDDKLTYGLYNSIGKLVIPCNDIQIRVGENIDIVYKSRDRAHYFYDENGCEKFKIEGLSRMPYKYCQGFCCIYRHEGESRKCAFIDEQGNQICDFKYDMGYKFSEGFASLKLGDYYGMINSNGQEVLDFIYQYINNICSIIKNDFY